MIKAIKSFFSIVIFRILWIYNDIHSWVSKRILFIKYALLFPNIVRFRLRNKSPKEFSVIFYRWQRYIIYCARLKGREDNIKYNNFISDISDESGFSQWQIRSILEDE